MIIPIRCNSCGMVLANKWNIFMKLKKEMSDKEALDKVGLVRYCCRTMLRQHVNIIDDFLKFDYYDHKIPKYKEEEKN